MYKTLTKRQKEILDYIDNYAEVKGYAPSLEEVKKHFRLKAVSTVHEHIENLKKKGYLKKEINQARGIEVIDPTLDENNFAQIQNLGTITAGEPIEAVEDPEPLLVSKELLSANGTYYALTVKGDSMVEEGILDGDIVVVRQQKTADNGEAVIAVLQDNLATLKKFYKEKNRVCLQPANDALKPKYYRNIEIRGKVVSLIRKFK
ncbi:transcriptional repressor LexA [Candidatus Dojkabacteria bacterium]|nr:transcriptional repressor LexA [Candidatus Dojkabacteria bacterium]